MTCAQANATQAGCKEGNRMTQWDVVVIGAGAAGLMCAGVAAARGRRVLVIDKARKPGEKIRISGGGRCNFTNLHSSPKHFLSDNPHFCISALARFTPQHFIHMVEAAGIAYHEKTLGQLFCDGSSQQIIDLLLQRCDPTLVTLRMEETLLAIQPQESDGFLVQTSAAQVQAANVVLASGGPSIPKMGATGVAYDVAKSLDIPVINPRPALVPFILDEAWMTRLKPLAGVSLEVEAQVGKIRFREGMLVTHKGLSGPAMLQISSYWEDGQPITLNLAPDRDVLTALKAAKISHPKQDITTCVSQWLPKRWAAVWIEWLGVKGNLAEQSHAALERLAQQVQAWQVIPSGTEGYRTAEVTRGGVDTRALSSQTMEVLAYPGLYVIGEAVDVTGHLGGHNFQWAWASGHAAGMAV